MKKSLFKTQVGPFPTSLPAKKSSFPKEKRL